MVLRHSTLAHTGLEELTEAWNRCWQGYPYIMNFNESHMKAWLRHGQVNLDRSVALLDSGRIIGFSLLSQDQDEGWIAGTGIDPEFRGKRLFKPLMQLQIKEAVKSGIRQIFLEVLSQNYAAAKVYEAVGFKRNRELLIYRIPARSLESIPSRQILHPFHEASLADYFAARRHAQFAPSWQRRENYLRKYFPLKALLSLNSGSGFLLTGERGTTLVDAWSESLEQSQHLFTSIRGKISGEFALTNQPKDWFSAFLTQHHILPTSVQYEMVLKISL